MREWVVGARVIRQDDRFKDELVRAGHEIKSFYQKLPGPKGGIFDEVYAVFGSSMTLDSMTQTLNGRSGNHVEQVHQAAFNVLRKYCPAASLQELDSLEAKVNALRRAWEDTKRKAWETKFSDKRSDDRLAVWMRDQIRPCLRMLADPGTRGIYLVGARQSGKSELLGMLLDVLSRENPKVRSVTINLKDLLLPRPDILPTKADDVLDMAMARIWQALGRKGRWKPKARPVDFKMELAALLKAEGQPVYLIVENGDAALRSGDVIARKNALASTTPFYVGLAAILDSSTEKHLRSCRCIVVGSRPKVDLLKAYQDSLTSMHNLRPYVLKRLERRDLDSILSHLSVLSDEGDKILEETGGHRSLVWAVYLHGKQNEGHAAVAALQSRGVRDTINVLWDELRWEADYLDAFECIAANQPVDGMRGYHLVEMMFATERPGGGFHPRMPIFERHVAAQRPKRSRK